MSSPCCCVSIVTVSLLRPDLVVTTPHLGLCRNHHGSIYNNVGDKGLQHKGHRNWVAYAQGQEYLCIMCSPVQVRQVFSDNLVVYYTFVPH